MSHRNGGVFELLDEVIRQHGSFDVVSGAMPLVRQLSQACPDQQSTMNVIALNARFSTLASFNPRQLLDLAVHLLNLPAHRTHFSCALRRRLSDIVSHDVIRAVGRHLDPEQLHLVVSWKISQLDPLAIPQRRLIPLQAIDRPIGQTTVTIIDHTVTLDGTVKELLVPVKEQHQFLAGIPRVHQDCLEHQAAAQSILEHRRHMIQFAPPILPRIINAVVDDPELAAMRMDVDTTHQSDTIGQAMGIAAPLLLRYLDPRSKTLVENGVVKDQIRFGMLFEKRLHLLPQMSWAQSDPAQIAIDGVVRKTLKMIGQVRQRIVHLATHEELAIIQLAKTHTDSLQNAANAALA